MPKGFHFHLIRLGTFTGKNVLTLKIAVHHDNYRLIVIQFADYHRHGFKTGQFTSTFAPMTGNQLIFTVRHGPRDGRYQHTVFFHAFCCFSHAFIVHNTKGMIFEGAELRQRDLLNTFLLYTASAFLRGKDIIVGCQAYVSAAAFQSASPPSSVPCKQWQLSPSDHGHKCFSLQRISLQHGRIAESQLKRS